MTEHNFVKQSGEIVIYQSRSGSPDISIRLENDTLWLDQYQIAELFQTNRTSIVKHIKNIYATGELTEKSTCAFFAQVQSEGKRTVNRTIKIYNLDIILSVGYRVNSIQGTRFRIWANTILKEHLITGYTKNETRLKELKKTIEIVNRVNSKTLTSVNESAELIKILSDYSSALDLLDDYDHARLVRKGPETPSKFNIDYKEATKAIALLKTKFGGSSLFGREKDDSFKGSIATIDQTFDGAELYKGVEEKAAHLLYFVTKNHSFSDGNKRIAAWLFIWYLDKNDCLYDQEGKIKIAKHTLVALTLMIAESNPNEKELIISVIINLMQK